MYFYFVFMYHSILIYIFCIWFNLVHKLYLVLSLVWCLKHFVCEMCYIWLLHRRSHLRPCHQTHVWCLLHWRSAQPVRIKKTADNEHKQLLHVVPENNSNLRMCKFDLYVSVGGALPWIIIKDGDHPASFWGQVPCSWSSSLARICQSNREEDSLTSRWSEDHQIPPKVPRAWRHAAHPVCMSDPLSLMLSWEVTPRCSNMGKQKLK